MRLSPKELHSIQAAFSKIIPSSFKLYLFGSRLDDKKRGGDIDLLVVTSRPDDKEMIAGLKTSIRLEIFKTLPEQRIDITVATEEECHQDEFLSVVFPGAQLLLG